MCISILYCHCNWLTISDLISALQIAGVKDTEGVSDKQNLGYATSIST